MTRLDGRVALITGAGAGIGRAIAEAYGREGAIVLAADIDAAAAREAADAVIAAGGRAEAATLDVTDGAAILACLAQIRDAHGRLDILVNNAGLNVRGDFRHISDDDWEKIRATNLDSAVRLSRDAFELLRLSGRGVIINVASIMADRGLRQLTGYSATKGAIIALTRGIAVEYAPFNIRATYIAPGFVETALTERILRVPAFSKGLVDQTPMRRLGRPDDIAGGAVFLASDEAAYITGSGLTIDGGMSAAL